MKALVFERKPTRYAAAMAAGRVFPGTGAKVGPLKLKDIEPPGLPGPDWVYIKPRLAGICGSDLATIDGKSSRYFEPIVSFPFTPGHEVVADLVDPSDPRAEPDGSRRVVLEPVLGCVTRNIVPVCRSCAAGDLGRCENIAFGSLQPGLQSGFCCDTGGGWSTLMVAHPTQLHEVPAELSDEDAVMVEPTACAVHSVLSAPLEPGQTVVVLGAGALGLLVIAALGHFAPDAFVIATAKHPLQQSLSRELGATHVVEPDQARRMVRRTTATMAIGDGSIDRLAGGADHVFDCVGSEETIREALSIARPGATITLVGMPGVTTVDLTALWQRELKLAGTYAYGTETIGRHQRRRTFDLAFELVQAARLGRLVSATYPLARYEDAIAHAANAGGRGAVRVAFDLRTEKERRHL